MKDIYNDLEAKGWSITTCDSDLLTFASTFGNPIPTRVGGPLVDELRLLSKTVAHSNSQSGRHGLGSFPFHVDGSHNKNIPKYIILRLKSPERSLTQTLLCDPLKNISNSEKKTLTTEPWKFVSGRTGFYAPLLDERGLRYDPNVMHEAIRNPKSVKILEAAIRASNKSCIEWRKNLTAIIDNRRLLHARTRALEESENRIIERISII